VSMRDISLLILCAAMAFALGCADADDEGGVAESAICQPARSACTGDTICGDTGCEPAFDRSYEVRVVGVWMSGKGFERCVEDPACNRTDVSNVTVYFSDSDDPIISGDTAPAEILVGDGSYLVVEIGEANCKIDLTAERLRSGRASCGDQTRSALLTLHAL
jgi:hypothetical protein